MSPRPLPFQSVVRRNLRRLRMKVGWRQEDLALKARARGLRWSASTVTAIEIGRRPVSAGKPDPFASPHPDSLPEPVSLAQGEGARPRGVALPPASLGDIASGGPFARQRAAFLLA